MNTNPFESLISYDIPKGKVPIQNQRMKIERLVTKSSTTWIPNPINIFFVSMENFLIFYDLKTIGIKLKDM